jgi:hypothetical protein
MSCLDIEGLLAFCWVSQSFICCLVADLLLASPEVLVLDVSEDEDGEVELGYCVDWEGMVDCWPVSGGAAAAIPAAASAAAANTMEIRFM